MEVGFSSAKEKEKGKQKDGVPEPDRTDLELRDFVFSSVVPLLTNFCARHFTVSDSTKEYATRYLLLPFYRFPYNHFPLSLCLFVIISFQYFFFFSTW